MKKYNRVTMGTLNGEKINRWAVINNRLFDLENKIVDGTLIERPPVKKGDWVYVIHREKYCGLFDDKPLYRKKGVWRVVDKIFLNNDNTFTISTLAVSSGGYKNRSIVKSTTFNKSWFLTKEEVETKLKETVEVNNG